MPIADPADTGDKQCVIFRLQKSDAEPVDEEEKEAETLKPSPDADTVILFTKPANQREFFLLG